MLLRDIAHSRTGDKGNISNVSVIVHDMKDWPLVQERLTPERLRAHLSWLPVEKIERFSLPQLGALNFVLHGALKGGVTRSLALDAHGKCLSSAVLELDLNAPACD
ncbi:hypothetical protein [Roseibium aggregatum]|uniref:AtuA-like ferredoxin-fold domain-containing protein n=1 Tax=Roseibium aggregatum TaxID=187304 RepID=A0A939J4T3_9HYPH|nr:hypothetical protein [Roseibium aggregatum]MBN9671505.1 hypothetical protein [Roseibium aggregatum]